jgi:transposase
LEEVERRLITDMLERTNWNQTEAAERFQVPLSTLNQKIKRLGIETRRRLGGTRGSAPYDYPGEDGPAEYPAGK